MDLDKDSRPDLVFSSRAAAPGIVHVFRYIGSGKFESKLQLTTSPNPWGLAIGDLNGDKKEEIVVVGSSGSKVDVLMSQVK